MTEERYRELLEAAPAIKRDEITRVQMYEPMMNYELYAAVQAALGLRPLFYSAA